VLGALGRADVVVIAPSNPFVSVAPILAVRGVRAAVARSRHRVVAISPLVAGRPVKGPLHRMLAGLGLEVSARGVARCYRGLADTFVLDRADAALAPGIEALGMRVLVADTLMTSAGRAARLAGVVLDALGRRP